MDHTELQPNLCWLIEHISGLQDRPAIIERSQTYSYGQLYTAIKSALVYIRQNRILPGQRVVLLSNCSFHSVAVFLALFQNKNIIIPLITTTKNEIEEKLDIANPEHIINVQGEAYTIESSKISIKKLPHFQDLVDKHQAGLVLFSSGSTGKTKAMLHNLSLMIDTYRGKPLKNINILIFLLFDHIGGIDTLLRALTIGATLTIPESRDPIYIGGLIERHRINILPATPTFLNLLLLSGTLTTFDLSSLQIIGYGAEPMPEYLLKKLADILPHVELQQKYGTSETNAVRVVSRSGNSLFIKIEDPNVEYKIIDGELYLRSISQIMGYLNMEANRFNEDNWFMTGDLVEVAPDGYFRIIGRINDLINIGGEKVFPTEVESIIQRIPGVEDCLVYGEPNVITGQRVVAEIQFQPDAKILGRQSIMIFCRDYLAEYKIPSKIKIVEKISYSDRYKKTRKHFNAG